MEIVLREIVADIQEHDGHSEQGDQQGEDSIVLGDVVQRLGCTCGMGVTGVGFCCADVERRGCHGDRAQEEQGSQYVEDDHDGGHGCVGEPFSYVEVKRVELYGKYPNQLIHLSRNHNCVCLPGYQLPGGGVHSGQPRQIIGSHTSTVNPGQRATTGWVTGLILTGFHCG